MYIDYLKLCNNSLINPMFMFLGYCVMPSPHYLNPALFPTLLFISTALTILSPTPTLFPTLLYISTAPTASLCLQAAQHLLPANKPLVYAAYPNLPAALISAAPILAGLISAAPIPTVPLCCSTDNYPVYAVS